MKTKNLKIIAGSLVLASALSFGLASDISYADPSEVDTIYVNNGGFDHLDGSASALAVGTITRAMQLVDSDGDIIKLESTINHTGTPLILKKDGVSHFVIEGTSGYPAYNLLETSGNVEIGSDITFRNISLKIKNGSETDFEDGTIYTNGYKVLFQDVRTIPQNNSFNNSKLGNPRRSAPKILIGEGVQGLAQGNSNSFEVAGTIPNNNPAYRTALYSIDINPNLNKPVDIKLSENTLFMGDITSTANTDTTNIEIDNRNTTYTLYKGINSNDKTDITITARASNAVPVPAKGYNQVYVFSGESNSITVNDVSGQKSFATIDRETKTKELTVNSGAIFNVNNTKLTADRVDSTAGKLFVTLNTPVSPAKDHLAVGEFVTGSNVVFRTADTALNSINLYGEGPELVLLKSTNKIKVSLENNSNWGVIEEKVGTEYVYKLKTQADMRQDKIDKLTALINKLKADENDSTPTHDKTVATKGVYDGAKIAVTNALNDDTGSTGTQNRSLTPAQIVALSDAVLDAKLTQLQQASDDFDTAKAGLVVDTSKVNAINAIKQNYRDLANYATDNNAVYGVANREIDTTSGFTANYPPALVSAYNTAKLDADTNSLIFLAMPDGTRPRITVSPAYPARPTQVDIQDSSALWDSTQATLDGYRDNLTNRKNAFKKAVDALNDYKRLIAAIDDLRNTLNGSIGNAVTAGKTPASVTAYNNAKNDAQGAYGSFDTPSEINAFIATTHLISSGTDPSVLNDKIIDLIAKKNALVTAYNNLQGISSGSSTGGGGSVSRSIVRPNSPSTPNNNSSINNGNSSTGVTPNSIDTAKSYLAKHDIMVGDHKGDFNDDAYLTRAEMATILHHLNREMMKELRHTTMPFKDVLAKSWYRNTVADVYTTRLFRGYSATRFEPNFKIDYGQLAVLLVRQYDIKNTLTKEQSEFKMAGTKAWNEESVRIISAKIDIKPLNITNASTPLTRSQVARILATVDDLYMDR